MANNKNQIAGVVLCGGRSSRMGMDKSTLIFKGHSLLEHMREQLQTAGIKKILIAGKSDERDAISDIIPGRGPLSGIHTALTQLQTEFTHLFIVPVDMPLLTTELLQPLISLESNAEASYYTGFILPLKLAVTDNIKTKVQTLLKQADNKKSSLKAFLSELKTTTLPLAEAMQHYFDNSNTPADWQRLTGTKL